MAKIFSQSITLAFFSPLLFLILFQEQNVAGNAQLSIISLQHSVVDEGNHTLTVHTRDGRSSRDVAIPHSFSE